MAAQPPAPLPPPPPPLPPRRRQPRITQPLPHSVIDAQPWLPQVLPRATRHHQQGCPLPPRRRQTSCLPTVLTSRRAAKGPSPYPPRTKLLLPNPSPFVRRRLIWESCLRRCAVRRRRLPRPLAGVHPHRVHHVDRAPFRRRHLRPRRAGFDRLHLRRLPAELVRAAVESTALCTPLRLRRCTMKCAVR